MSYFHAKRAQLAKQYLESREAERDIKIRDEMLERSREWLLKFRASGRSSRTGFDWRPRWPFNIGVIDVEKSEAREVLAITHAPSEGGRESTAETGADPAAAGSEAAPETEFDVPF